MYEVNEALQQLSNRFEQLISLCESIRVSNEKLRADKQYAETLAREQAEKIAALEEKNKELLLTDALVQTSKDNGAAKEKIDKIVLEIDKCISLFNKQQILE